MSQKRLSRRAALGVIGKTGVAFGAGTCFFLSLKTSPLAGAFGDSPIDGTAQAQAPRRKAVLRVPEKVVISGSGSTLTVKISGPPGRHCAVAYATTDAREHYKAVANSRGLIGENGVGAIEIDMKGFPDGKIFLRIVTGRTSAFDEDIAGTEPFVIRVSKGAIARYEGVLSRPLISAKGPEAVAATAAAACVGGKRR